MQIVRIEVNTSQAQDLRDGFNALKRKIELANELHSHNVQANIELEDRISELQQRIAEDEREIASIKRGAWCHICASNATFLYKPHYFCSYTCMAAHLEKRFSNEIK